MADDWEKEDYEPPSFAKKPAVGDRWEGEDEEDVKDNWDDEDEEKEATPPAEASATAVAPKKKKPLSQIIQEKEERRRREAEEKRAREEQQRAALTPEEEQAEKLRRQRMQEEADLQLAKEAFGLTESDGIDSLQPVTRDDFDNLRKALATKLTACERSPHYMGFLDDLLRDLSLNMEPEDVKRLSSSLNAVANEKVKQQKLKHKKKGAKKGASLNVGKDDGLVNLDDYGNEYDDFM
ncbi:eukaryotic translation initiation factor 3 subunit J isoform X2 [Rhipicephalus sanguineus]|uniref:eukaryotic translation initiation factor 3 subunit J isoform X2 n=1 Tax=Rhipicephalus sanguineus TaxID=34632 RepID=UPI001895F87E|nr:eukaryotic translation initiation factor 3 subunit J isoform X2 [Rhipicephalus sanguineus]